MGVSSKFPPGKSPWCYKELRPYDPEHPVCPNSFANADAIKATNYSLQWNVDMKNRVITGSVDVDCQVLKPTSTLVLDTSYLDIKSCQMSCSPDNDARKLAHTLADRNLYGQKMTINLGKEYKAGDHITVKVDYSTTSQSTAMQWLDPPQTAGKQHPFLFTQCEAIHARSLLPCQDTPAIKSTFKARVTCAKPLTALMSAVESQPPIENSDGTRTFSWEQKVCIPSYLIALAVGDLASRDVSPRCRIWAEPSVVEKAAWEFEDTEKFVQAGESLTVPHAWGRYDMLVMPAFFPYGGMEGQLTFMTPTLVAGDRSQIDVVAHEYMHSVFGNLVTNSSWENFYLNEGFTTFMEMKVMGRLYGEPVRQMSCLLGLKALKEAIDELGPTNPFTALVRDLRGKDPDDAFSTVPYMKGSNFLYYLEQVVGGAQNMEPWIKNYAETFAYKSITTDDFVQHFLTWFADEKHPGGGPETLKKLEIEVDWVAWLMNTGMPPVANKYDDSLARQADELAKKWKQGQVKDSNDWETMSSTQKMRFLDSLADLAPFTPQEIEAIDKMYNLSANRNSEIRWRWQELCLRSGYETIFPQVVDFITTQGRMKYVRPLYRALAKCSDKGKTLAIETFTKSRDMYHPICANLLTKDLGLTA